ncbi:hypothetical protein MVEN_00231000 [Mycena venus]|uniref:F-box domain-containing protein n=1 Tax=Mycena venus TaxID=2733690 RepID=A0A8H7DDK0_9AGAR|nr:hypothetical protein MVEN_00231000 [Mycena venus]
MLTLAFQPTFYDGLVDGLPNIRISTPRAQKGSSWLCRRLAVFTLTSLMFLALLPRYRLPFFDKTRGVKFSPGAQSFLEDDIPTSLPMGDSRAKFHKKCPSSFLFLRRRFPMNLVGDSLKTIQLPQDRFPQELIDEILDYFSHDYYTLRSCSLVSRAWASRSRSWVFQSCLLHSKNILPFHDLLRSPYSFLPHIRSIKAHRKYAPRKGGAFDQIAEDLRLVDVRNLTLGLYVTPKATLDGAETFFRTGFITAFPHVTHLVLNFKLGMGYPHLTPLVIDMLCMFPALEVLDIKEMIATFPNEPASAVPPSGLHSLKLCDKSVRPILAWLHAVGHLPKVDSLTLPLVRVEDVPTVRMALQQLGPALHHLDIMVTWSERYDGMYDFTVDPSTIFDFSLHRNLKTLAIHYANSYHDFYPNQMIQLLTKLESPALERLALKTYHLPDDTFNQWTALDRFLSPDRFPRLRNVVFSCWGDHEALRAKMPSLVSSRVLQTEYY